MTISIIAEVTRFLKEVEIARQEYFTKPVKDKLVEDYKGVYEFFNKPTYSKIKTSQVSEFKEIYKNVGSIIKKWNEE
jgi:hypothetical protein